MASLLLLVYASSACVNARAGNDGNVPIAKEYELDLTTRSAVQSIDPDTAEPQTKKFVQITVTNVINLRKIPLSFEVHYQPVQGEKLFLGTFALFPPDNPGNFIIATQGKVQTGGVIIVSFMPLEESSDLKEIHVRLRIALVGE